MAYLWLVFALLAVVGKTAYYTVQKRLLDGADGVSFGPLTIPDRFFDVDDVSSLELGYISAIYGLVLVGPVGVYQYWQSPPDVSGHVYAIAFAIALLELVALWTYLRALSLCDMSIASPLKKTKPALVALLEPVVLGTVFNPLLVAAAASTGIGGYVVLMKDRDLLAPLRRLTEPGPALALSTAVMYAVLSLGSRFGVTRLSPSMYGTIVFSVMAVGYRGFLARRGACPSLRTHLARPFILVGVLGVCRSLLVWMAYSLASATMVSIITQLTILLDVLVGGTLLKEGNTKQRLAGATLILVGVLAALLV